MQDIIVAVILSPSDKSCNVVDPEVQSDETIQACWYAVKTWVILNACRRFSTCTCIHINSKFDTGSMFILESIRG